MTAESVTGGQLVVDTLRTLGVEYVFGVPGGQTLAITDAMLGCPDLRFVATRHEGAAACMADAVGRLTARPGVCLATTGPGATNLLTGVGGAYRDSSPVIVLTCNNNLRDVERDDAQAANHVDIFRSLTKRAMFVGDASAIRQQLEEAYLIATTGCPGPVLVDFARNALESSVVRPTEASSPRNSDFLDPSRSLADPARVERAALLLSEAASPVIWLGNGAVRSGASQAVLKLADRLDAPVITTFTAIGAVPTHHPLVFGPKSRMGTALSSAVLAGADVLVAIGNSLNGVSTSRWSITLPDTIIQIDTEPAQLGRYYAARTVGLLGDASGVVGQLEEALGRHPSASGAVSGRRARLAALTTERDRWREHLGEAESRPGVIAPDRLVMVMREVAPDDTILVVDAGNPGVWTHLWEVRESGEYLKPVGFGNMGFALPAAIAAKLLRPSAPVLALIGDGSMAMTMGELETLAREGVAPCVVVMNDSSYGNIRQEQLMKYGDRTIGVDFRDVDFAAIAGACGVPGVRVDTEEGLRNAIRDAFASGRPAVIDARIDRDLSVWTYPPFVGHELEA